MGSSLTSGRTVRPLGLLLASVAVAGCTSKVTAPLGGTGTAVRPNQALVVILRAHEAHAAPASRSVEVARVPPRTPITEEQTVLPVLARSGHWLKVRLPGRPNSHTGWIDKAATAVTSTAWHIVVTTSLRQVTVYRSGRVVRRFEAVIGTASTPTPTGQFFVEESVALKPGDIGAPFALALSARSNVLQEFDGGPGQIAVHGVMNIGGVLGTASSHGCVRLANAAMRWLAVRIAPGVPVTIRST